MGAERLEELAMWVETVDDTTYGEEPLEAAGALRAFARVERRVGFLLSDGAVVPSVGLPAVDDAIRMGWMSALREVQDVMQALGEAVEADTPEEQEDPMLDEGCAPWDTR